MNINELQSLIKEEIRLILKTEQLSESEVWMTEDAILLGELLNPDKSYPYTGSKGWYKYNDMNDNTFFVRLTYQPTKTPYFELKTGWYDENGKANYDPSVPENSSALDWDKRSDTVAKIYRDEILPFFDKQKLCDRIIFKPISVSRYQFSKRLINKFTSDKYNIEEKYPKEIIITRK